MRFDEAFYLSLYPDVQAMINTGEYPSGADHWMMAGRHEVVSGRRLPPDSFNEDGYLAKRPDVAEAVARGVVASGFEHWVQIGRMEEREVEAQHTAPLDCIPEILSTDDGRFWHDNGFVVLRNLISDTECDLISQRLDWMWKERELFPITADVFIDGSDARRIPFREAPIEARSAPYKLNDMFLVDEDVRSLALNRHVMDVLRWIMGEDAVCVASLNFERGSTQEYHTDTLYMPGKRANGMAAAWFALEDVNPAAGPLLYYPGSHCIPLFLFSNGRPNQIDAEVPVYRAYMHDAVAERGLTAETFLANKGDVLIWNERLYHSGAKIEDPSLTRKSLVTHYWRASDLPYGFAERYGDGYYWPRAPL